MKKIGSILMGVILCSSLFSQNDAAKTNNLVSAIFTQFSRSMNVQGVLYSSAKPLQYLKSANTVAFVQRKSPTYTPSSNGNSSSVVVYYNKDLLNTWDSSCVFTDATQQTSQVQGGLYNPFTSSVTLSNCFLVTMGPTKTGTATSGNFYASKQVGSAGTNAPGTDMQLFANTPPFNSTPSPSMKKHDLSMNSFTSIDGDCVRSIGGIFNNVNGTTNVSRGYRGAYIVKGTLVAGLFVWSGDSVIPPVALRTDGSKQMSEQAFMAWNSTGTVGYVVFIGSESGKTGANVGWQPIVYKTTNSGSTWAILGGMNFNDQVGCASVLNSIEPIHSNPTLKIPNFNCDEGIDLVVDKCDLLHIVSTIKSTRNSQIDSVDATQAFPYMGEMYPWKFVYGSFPFLFDFRCDNSASWSIKKIDSIQTVGPGRVSGSDGFNYNPWADANPANSVSSGMRIQTSLSDGGEYIIYTWAEADTLLTTNAAKWNEFPDIHAKAVRMCDGAISTDEYLLSSPSTGFNPQVRNKAFFHYTASSCKGGATGPTSATFTIPVTVSNNATTDASVTINNYYSNVIVGFTFTNNACSAGCYTAAAINPTVVFNSVSEEENLTGEVNSYPNPFTGKLTLNFKTLRQTLVVADMYNYIGQLVMSREFNAQMGENIWPLNETEQMTPGVYLIKLRLSQGDVTRKVIKQ